MINDAYEIENGSTGVAFKSSNRIHFREDIENPIKSKNVVKAILKQENNEIIVGCIIWSEDENSLFFGPLAVHTNYQKYGIGKKLINHIEDKCRLKNKLILNMCVVNHRTDVIPIYEKLGFIVTGVIEPYYEPQYLTRDSYFIYYYKNIEK